LSFEIEDGGGVEEQGRISTVMEDVTNLAEDSKIVFHVQNNGALQIKAEVKKDQFNIPTGSSFAINDDVLLSATSLGSNVVTSSLTQVGTIGTGVWQGSLIHDNYVSNALTINSGQIDATVIGATTPAAGTFTTATFGAGGDELTITESNDDVTFTNTISNKDILFKVKVSASSTTAMTLQGSTGNVVIPAGKLNYGGAVVTATGTELNYLDIAALGTSEASKAVTANSDGDIVIGSNIDDVLTIKGRFVYEKISVTSGATVTITPGSGSGGTFFELSSHSGCCYI
jgi:hypothetical protein